MHRSFPGQVQLTLTLSALRASAHRPPARGPAHRAHPDVRVIDKVN